MDQGADWFEATRKRFLGNPEAFDAYYPERADEAFVGKSGLVFPMFSREKHTRDSDPFAWEDYDYLVIGMDPGGLDPTAIICLGIYRGQKNRRSALAPAEEWGVLPAWPGGD